MGRRFVLTWTKLLLAVLTLATFLPGSAFASRFRTLHTFGTLADGTGPGGGLIADQSGNFEGTTTEGGSGTACGTQGCGVVFTMKRNGSEKVLYSFQGGSNDGSIPVGRLLADQSGNLYGTTAYGYGNGCEFGNGCGTLFRVSPQGTETVLYAFKGGKNDGGNPAAGLIADRAGNLYGTTSAAGEGVCGGYGCGAVFRLAPDGSETVLHFFTGGKKDGADPQSPLMMDEAGNLYGTTDMGGSNACGGSGCGTMFKIATDGTETLLHVFRGGKSDGAYPQGALIADQSGNFYGTTVGGAHRSRRCGQLDCGTVFKLASDGTFTLLYAFKGGKNDGAFPVGALTEDAAGDLYGATEEGGHGVHIRDGGGCFPYEGCGSLFEISAGGSEFVLYRFKVSDGRRPVGDLLMDKSGDLFGTTELGGGNGCGYGCGTVFELKASPPSLRRTTHER